MTERKARVAVLVSGGGTNLQAIIDAEQSGILHSGTVSLVVSNNKTAFALNRAQKAGIPSEILLRKKFGSHAAFEEALIRILEQYEIDLIVLAGFMTILSEGFTGHFKNRIINVHPSLIPSFCGQGFYGLKVHEEALKKGVKVTGATVHYVNEIPDGGEIILQKAVAVLPGDTPEILQKRVMEQAEWKLLPEAVERISAEILQQKKEEDMDIYQVNDIDALIRDNSYVGRGIITGKSEDGKKAAAAYFIMGRSANSRNRIFSEKEEGIVTEPFDPSRVEDPSLIIYTAVRKYENKLILTNGDQTDTVYEGLKKGLSFHEALESRCFEPDAPNFTPRISAMITFAEGDFSYQMSILKSMDAEGSACARYGFSYPAVSGLGHFIHTYACDGDPIPTFQGEPERIRIPDDIDAFTGQIWNGLNEDNKISLYVSYTDLATGEEEHRLINKNV